MPVTPAPWRWGRQEDVFMRPYHQNKPEEWGKESGVDTECGEEPRKQPTQKDVRVRFTCSRLSGLCMCYRLQCLEPGRSSLKAILKTPTREEDTCPSEVDVQPGHLPPTDVALGISFCCCCCGYMYSLFSQNIFLCSNSILFYLFIYSSLTHHTVISFYPLGCF